MFREDFCVWANVNHSECWNAALPCPTKAPHHQCLLTLNKTQVGENLFVHAGLLPEHVRGPMAANKDSTGDEKTVADVEAVMEKVNAAARSWLLGEREIPEEMWAGDSPLWTRVYSDPESRDIDEAARLQLEEVRGRRCKETSRVDVLLLLTS